MWVLFATVNGNECLTFKRLEFHTNHAMMEFLDKTLHEDCVCVFDIFHESGSGREVRFR